MTPHRKHVVALLVAGTKVLPNVVSCSAVISACVRGAQCLGDHTGKEVTVLLELCTDQLKPSPLLV